MGGGALDMVIVYVSVQLGERFLRGTTIFGSNVQVDKKF